MSIAIQCPRCQATFGITDDRPDEPITCPKCLNVFRQGPSAGIQAGLPRPRESDDDEPPRSRPHPSPRAPFPTVPLLIVACGLLFLLLVLSAGFNVWIAVNPDVRLQQEQAVAEQQADVARVQALQVQAENARAQRAEQQEARLKRDLDDLARSWKRHGCNWKKRKRSWRRRNKMVRTVEGNTKGKRWADSAWTWKSSITPTWSRRTRG